MIKYYIVVFILLINTIVLAQEAKDPESINFIRSFTPIRDNSTTIFPVTGQVDHESNWSEKIMYYDGLGRPMQNILVSGMANGNSLITPIVYDQMGRQTKEYLPFSIMQNQGEEGSFNPTAINDQKSFYENVMYQDPEYTFSETVLEKSPLAKVLRQGAAGRSWNVTDGHFLQTIYSSNDVDEIHKCYVSSSNELIIDDVYYPNSLFKTSRIDEDSQMIVEYKDLLGHIVQRTVYASNSEHLITIFVYDYLGLLRYVISPEAVSSYITGSVGQTVNYNEGWVKSLCYYYEYDNKNRLVKKQLPGKEMEYMIYDDLDRMRISQDGMQRSNNLWSFIKYDVFNRPIMTGQFKNTTTISPEDMKLLLDGNTNSNEQVDTGEFYGYSNNSFPILNNTSDVFIVNMYDNYKYYKAQSETFKERYAFYNAELDFLYDMDERVVGQITTTLVKNLDTDQTVDTQTEPWQTTVYYFDQYGNMIQSVSNEMFSTTKVNSFTYNFTGQLMATNEHLIYPEGRTNDDLSVVQTFTYDRMGNPLVSTHNINNDTLIRLSSQSYDALGRLSTKKLHQPEASLTWKQQINYNYNIRNWLTGQSNTLFSFTLYYDQADPTPSYTGNIGQMNYTYPAFTGKYNFVYDGASRLKEANHGSTADLSTAYDYDRNGNIMLLYRQGIDSLTYTYSGNQLRSVNDVEDSYCQYYGFTDDGFFETTEYAYDNNGNMVVDLNKQISEVKYNHLNLPKQINIIGKGSFNNVFYKYNALGQKTFKQTKTDGQVLKTNHYLGNFVFEDGSLKRILTPEGIVEPQGGVMVYQYFIKDHLGNTRVVVDENNLVRQTNSYYPFGMLVETAHMSKLGYETNKYLYNGKELQDEFGLDWYDYGARFYDAEIGRWHVVDPMAEKYPIQTPYNYAANNPILFIDWKGLKPELFINGEAAEHATKQLQQATNLVITRDSETGKISAMGKAKTSDDKRLQDIINSNDNTVNINAINSNEVAPGIKFTGGAFMGNEVTSESEIIIEGTKPYKPTEISISSVETKQIVNPNVLNQIDSYYGKPGAGMLHEVTESFEGGKISLTNGVSSPSAIVQGSVYQEAHNAATPQPGPVYSRDVRGRKEFFLHQYGRSEVKIN